MRCLGIDYGSKRIGLAYGDELGLAMPIAAAVAATEKERIAEIEAVVRQRRITDLVLGWPFNMDGSEGFKVRETEAFARKLEGRFGLPIHKVDERLTTHAAESGLRAMGRPTKTNKRTRASGDIDSRAAALILQDFLDQRMIAENLHFPEDPSLPE